MFIRNCRTTINWIIKQLLFNNKAKVHNDKVIPNEECVPKHKLLEMDKWFNTTKRWCKKFQPTVHVWKLKEEKTCKEYKWIVRDEVGTPTTVLCPPPWTLSRTTLVSQYQKKHSPTHTYRGHQSSLICFIHLLRSMASSLFNLRAWQSLCTISQVFFGLPLALSGWVSSGTSSPGSPRQRAVKWQY